MIDCPICNEPRSMHRLLGEEISPFEWHGIFTGKGRSLKPSDALPIKIPSQRQRK